ncbi:hypothetical protein Q7M76_02920 [Candidatus Liberibacter asiaticus]|uniref:Transmembrane protein n=2 Tax=Liberibacter asiaticus TaxID=34021 RepID=A0ABN4B0P3_LIBAS|nr:hypothetical protein [Candidatus Liberibacter asiaticus]ACT57085.1 putative transmembrane protein [Candidatus Liberibacter asiaticus str. psy62]AGH16950.1 putative transmembrane protein [Candidatus Liberibacter asiaticus str. gxpsy]ALK07289.1 hypothetical protein CD16_02930 [Candidatus Liberibacter asiaticus]ASK52778.1 hypothetical protein B2I23_02975 [Candidatus Liberibacter asiaticus]AWL14097.1 hypothetical protein DIC79_03000 [Candidatus Liberibacter asiaticus]
MVDFILVIQRAVDNLPENTPERRSHIYEHARNSVARRLESMKPRLPKEILERQFNKLEQAILQVEKQNQKSLHTSKQDKESDIPKSSVTSKENIFLEPRLRSISSILRSNKHKKLANILSVQGKSRTNTNLSPKNFSCRLREILSFSVNTQHEYDSSVSPVAAIEHDKSRLRRGKLAGIFSFPTGSIFWSVHNYFFNKTRGLLSFYSALSEHHLFKYFVFLIILLGMAIGVSYSIGKSKGSITHFLRRESLDGGNVDKKNVFSGIRPKITRRLLEDGSEVDVGPSTIPVADFANTSNIAFKNYIGGDENSTFVLGKKEIEEGNPLIGEGRVFINKGRGQSSILSGKILWSLQQEKSQGLKGLVIKGDIPMIDNAFSASMTLKCNADISLSITHVMEIMFSFPKESQDAVVDLRRISMRKTDNSPSVLIDSNIFVISKNSYLISLKGSEEDPFRNSKILEEYRFIDIPITYRSGQKILFTIDKGKKGADIFKSAIMQWENRSNN